MAKHIEDFQKLNIGVNDILEENNIDVFIDTLMDNIQHEVLLWEHNSLEKESRVERNVESKIMETTKSKTQNYKDGSVVAPRLPQPTRLMPQQLEKKREKALCYRCDRKYTKGHKSVEKKLFYIDCEEEEKEQEIEKEEDIHQEPTPEKEDMNKTISCNALERTTTPKTLKVEGYIKKKQVIMVID